MHAMLPAMLPGAHPHQDSVPSPTLSLTDPVPRGLLTLCPTCSPCARNCARQCVRLGRALTSMPPCLHAWRGVVQPDQQQVGCNVLWHAPAATANACGRHASLVLDPPGLFSRSATAQLCQPPHLSFSLPTMHVACSRSVVLSTGHHVLLALVRAYAPGASAGI